MKKIVFTSLHLIKISGRFLMVYLFVFSLTNEKCSAQQPYLSISDTRAVNDAPGDFMKKAQFDFKFRSITGVPGTGSYSAMMTIAPWSNASGGKNHQLNFNDGGIFYRDGVPGSAAWEGWRELVVKDINGNLGIGTTDTKGYRLAVAGNMIAESVKVKLVGAWPDYVFTKDYELPSLQETEKQIQETGHLPDIPSATEVKADGIDLGEMNAKLLKKVEELTLYIINQDKELKEQNQKFQQQISAQQLQINQLKTKTDQQ